MLNRWTCAQETYYLVKWEGYEEEENTWESADSLAASGDDVVNTMIAEFEAKARKDRAAGGEIPTRLFSDIFVTASCGLSKCTRNASVRNKDTRTRTHARTHTHTHTHTHTQVR